MTRVRLAWRILRGKDIEVEAPRRWFARGEVVRLPQGVRFKLVDRPVTQPYFVPGDFIQIRGGNTHLDISVE